MRAFERLWPQPQEHPAGVFQTRFGELPGARHTLRSMHRSVQAAGRLEVQQNPCKLLNQGIVDLASQPPAFFNDGRARKSFHKQTLLRVRGKFRTDEVWLERLVG